MIFVMTTLKGYIVSVACVIENMEHGQKNSESVSHFSILQPWFLECSPGV